MQDPNNSFPFDIRDVEGTDDKELSKYFLGAGNFSIQVGPKKYLLMSDYKHDAENIYNMRLRYDDIFVVTYPRSGTTWTQELVWLLASDLDYSTAEKIPLSSRSIFLEFPMLMHKNIVEHLDKEHADKPENLKNLQLMRTPGSEQVARMPSPRFIRTHLPLSLLPPTLLDTTKVVYVARDPRDVAVSYYYLSSEFKSYNFNGDFKSYWRLFVKDLVYWSPFFEHLKEAWQMRQHPNMLFLFYEELLQNLPATVQRVADFLGKEYKADQIAELCTHLKFENFKKNPSVGIDNLKEYGMMAPKGEFIRKGKSGGWRDYFDEEMTREAQLWIDNNLQDTDMRFPSMQ
ncbi:PREDICTED: sulfotransferase family cytosolic 1B member 1-like isoform X1 [Papilio xuthus]|uniref:Sulfotransferase family cytosolic 1B member 1-like isoform X1 n=1 Tax=Papilio xuthus TaxID=66420 RepID=A0AAJ6ZWT6_PAPXU|nr:PREDICTED: sulfotransferase family cytosolic 1B member 1-like isoform X1 [Papilio xuthus]